MSGGREVLPGRRPIVIAHRGASARAPENSLEALRLAVDLRADGVEFDVHATRDLRFVVHHDPALPGLGPIAGLAAAEARAARLGNGEPPPFLEEALAELAGLEAFIEVKAMPVEAAGALFDAIDRTAGPRRCAVHSFDHSLVARLAARRRNLRFGLLLDGAAHDPAGLLAAAGALDLWPRRDLVTPALVRDAHAAGARVITWTVDLPADIRRLSALGVDGICSNVPDVARAAIAEAA
ncbi:MAG TPA: glycerophosphodiester phosphodiesterase [Gemmatimonadales bacterium]|nr:glycerophosphodiester phosphodiesterase [Gemmatimonadales bacterium]